MDPNIRIGDASVIKPCILPFWNHVTVRYFLSPFQILIQFCTHSIDAIVVSIHVMKLRLMIFIR